jgi:hypothetical protein
MKRYTKDEWFGAASTCDEWTRVFYDDYADHRKFYRLFELFGRPYLLVLNKGKKILPDKTFSTKNLEAREYLGIQIALEKAGY